MSDDDFGFDDDDFDAADLAKIDEIEQKYIATQAPPSRPAPVLPARPSQDRYIRPFPAKRIRSNDWNESSRPNRTIQEIDDDKPPEAAVVARRDGTYIPADSLTVNTRGISFAVPSALPPRTASDYPATPTAVQRVEQTPTPVYSQGQRTSPAEGSAHSHARFAAITAALEETNLNGNAASELAQAKAEITRLRELQEATEASLKAAKEEKWTKDGEISTMRRSMAKMTASHAETINKLQAEKQQAEDKRKQQERQSNQEMERLRSSLALRRQELETSTRKTPWSTRRHSSIMPTPARMRDAHRLSVNETPSRPSHPLASQAHFGREDGAEIATVKREKGKSKVNQPPAFGSLVDSFQDHSPVKRRAPAKPHEDGKIKERVPNMEEIFPPLEQPGASRPSQLAVRSQQSQRPIRDLPAADWGTNEPDLMLEFEQETETQDTDAMVEDMILPEEEEEEPLEVMDMTDQCIRLLFSHTSLPSYQFTLQILLSVFIPEEPPDHRIRYTEACSSLIEALGARTVDYTAWVSRILISLLEIAQVLSPLSSITALSGIFNLFATMCLFLPSTISMLLPGMEESPPILSALADVFRSHALPSSQPYTDEQALLLKESLNLFEVLCLTAPKDSSQQLKHLLHAHRVMSNLLNDQQPLWVLQTAARALSILCCEHDNFRFVLAFPNPPPNGKEPKRDPTRIPLLERLSYMLVDKQSGAQQKDQIQLQMSILTCLTQLAIASPDALSILLASQALIPALVTNLNNCTTIVWDGDETGLDDAALLSILQIIQGSLQLLHYLIFRGDSEIDLQHKLQYPPQKFNGLGHMFVIGLGRLSYADPPEWHNQTAKELAESSAELARDLLEQVVEGPEVDTIWASYQGSEGDSQAEEDEMEAMDEDMVIID